MSIKLGITLIIIMLCFAFDYNDIYKNANIWYKVSSDEHTKGEIVALDMSEGFSGCDGPHLFLVVNTVESGERTVIAFPNRGKWYAEKVDTVSVEIQKYFGKLEEDLRNDK